MTVAELRDRMGEGEFQEWCEFYRFYPFDDLHRFYRPAAMVALSLGGGDVTQRLQWLQPDPIWATSDLNTMAALGVKPP